MVDKEKIFQPLLKKIVEKYLAQRDSYQKITLLTKKQAQIKGQEEMDIFTELAAEKEIIFQEIAQRNEYLRKVKSDIVKALKIEEFTISSLREKLKTPVIEELFLALTEIGHSIKELENAEKDNEENLKRILNLS